MSTSPQQSSPTIGCARLPDRTSLAKYFEKLRFLETDIAFVDPPRPKKLRRWREKAGADAVFAVVACHRVTHDRDASSYAREQKPLAPELAAQAGSLRATDVVREAWQQTVEAAQALNAQLIVLRTPQSFSPSTSNRDALERFAETHRAPDGMSIAWHPSGIWEPPETVRLCQRLGWVPTLDPLQLEDPLEQTSSNAYLRLEGLGVFRDRFSQDHLDTIVDHAGLYDQCWIAFANRRRFTDAQTCRREFA